MSQRSRKDVLEDALVVVEDVRGEGLAVADHAVPEGLVEGFLHDVEDHFEEAAVDGGAGGVLEVELLAVEVDLDLRELEDILPQGLAEHHWPLVVLHEFIVGGEGVVEVLLVLGTDGEAVPVFEHDLGAEVLHALNFGEEALHLALLVAEVVDQQQADLFD